jgi:hypothetical protein
MATQMERFVGEDIDPEDYAFLRDNRIALEDPVNAAARRATDPAVIARLLVLAAELAQDVEAISRYAEVIQEGAIRSYREYVIERHLYRGGEDAS